MRTITPDDMAQLLHALAVSYPGFTLVVKPFPSERCTTWGAVVTLPTDWYSLSLEQQYVRLRHEAVHLAQFQMLGTWRFGWQWLWAEGRRRLECDAFVQEMAAVVEIWGATALRDKRPYYLAQMTGPAYNGMWADPPGAAAAWLDGIIAALTQTEATA